ncbi:alanine racemase [Actinoplanes couchii]|uniref:Alanine racemase n=1 Tax=Actinoplanes couchii TaxID=403638 RepID=A0ABQ3XKQ0_9ACTN|nr:alanine racemase [Actinoplanes couchii]MDR6319531.1 alanine racemase [Actinoplanes couchii]GID59079.1 alanine racemase [Actinoplanes couchii]
MISPLKSAGEAVVDLAAVAANVRTVAAATGTAVMAVVKADGFGHGAVAVARAAVAAGATWLGATSAREALELRAAGLTAPVLSWLHPPDEDFARLIAAHVDLGVSTVAHLHAVAAAARTLGRPAHVQLKVDIGLSRNGAGPDDWPELVAWAHKYETEETVRVRGVWSHPAGEPATDREIATYEDAVRVARAAGLDPPLLHLANSVTALAVPRARFGLCRIGIALYGVGPGLRPVMTLRSRVVNVKRVPAGTGVSYGPDHVTDRPVTLALLPLGYADGVPRAVRGRAEVWLGGRRCPIVGRIAMDQCVVDAGDLPVRLGDPVVLFGAGPGEPTVDEWARWAGTNPHEILTGVGTRIPRLHQYGEVRHQ